MDEVRYEWVETQMCCNTLQHTATHCNTLQHTATHCSMWQCAISQNRLDVEDSLVQCVAVCCSVLQCVAACCSVLQYVAVCYLSKSTWRRGLSSSVCCSVLQCVAVCCSVLQCVAVCCSMWQCAISQNRLDVQDSTLAVLIQLVFFFLSRRKVHYYSGLDAISNSERAHFSQGFKTWKIACSPARI